MVDPAQWKGYCFASFSETDTLGAVAGCIASVLRPAASGCVIQTDSDEFIPIKCKSHCSNTFDKNWSYKFELLWVGTEISLYSFLYNNTELFLVYFCSSCYGSI